MRRNFIVVFRGLFDIEATATIADVEAEIAIEAAVATLPVAQQQLATVLVALLKADPTAIASSPAAIAIQLAATAAAAVAPGGSDPLIRV